MNKIIIACACGLVAMILATAVNATNLSWETLKGIDYVWLEDESVATDICHTDRVITIRYEERFEGRPARIDFPTTSITIPSGLRPPYWGTSLPIRPREQTLNGVLNVNLSVHGSTLCLLRIDINGLYWNEAYVTRRPPHPPSQLPNLIYLRIDDYAHTL